ncbi:hypothetical protein PSTT_13850 [Puccinia striiformis]|uniref:Uncharacterized protein n=1 Tax=Puccinia striiformis TaxID=27350 RepID=A0A2S4UPU2_9BASI|nr:hypothetical protein PSTT_13850 [Puccinia striiformis]
MEKMESVLEFNLMTWFLAQEAVIPAQMLQSFRRGPNPNPVCGVVPILPSRVVDISSFVSQAVDAGIPSVFSNGSIPLTVFQINRIGGGPMTCEYSSDATGNSWQPMDMTLNMAGNFGSTLNRTPR